MRAVRSAHRGCYTSAKGVAFGAATFKTVGLLGVLKRSWPACGISARKASVLQHSHSLGLRAASPDAVFLVEPFQIAQQLGGTRGHSAQRHKAGSAVCIALAASG